MQPVHLSKSNIDLHPGMMITTPSHAIHTDPEYNAGGDDFDGLRFYDADSNTTSPRATTTTNRFLVFGYGTQVCPGRFLGIKMAQLLFAKMVMDWDMEFWPPRDGNRKPENQFFPGQMMPDLKQKIRLRRRATTTTDAGAV
jgi:cytochrome P450